MKKLLSSICEAANILHSTFIFIFLALLLENFYTNYFAVNLKPHFLLLYLTAFITIKSVIYAGILGSLVEIAIGEEVLVSVNHFKKNALQFWKTYFTLTLISFLIHFGVSIILYNHELSFLPFLTSGLTLLFNIIFLIVILYTKYLKPSGQSFRNIQMSLTEGGLVSTFFLCEFTLRTFILVSLPNQLFLSPLTLLVARYIHLLTGILLLIFIRNNNKVIGTPFKHDKEIYLISPIGSGLFFGIGSLFQSYEYSGFFLILQSLTPPGYKFRTFVRRLWHERYYKKDKLVAITCLTPNSYEAYRIAKKYKQMGSKVIMGGPHVSYFPNEALDYCDSVVIGEAEGVWSDIVKDYENNQLKRIYNKQPDPKDYQQVYQGLLNASPSIIKHYVETTNGCKFKCDFCTIPGISNGQTRTASINNIVTLVKKISEKHKKLIFIDNNIYSDPGYARELFTNLKPLNIKWSSQCTIDIAKNEQTLQLAKDSGCQMLCFGYEIANNSLEKSQKGKFTMAKTYASLTRLTKQKGIKIKGNFIFGFETDTFKSLIHLWLCCMKIRPSTMALYLLTPMPGSKVFTEMLENNQISNLNWRRYTTTEFVFKHNNLNTRLLNIFYPFINVFFLTTTSKEGAIIGFTILILLIQLLLYLLV